MQGLTFFFLRLPLFARSGTNYIGGTGEGQSDAAWRVPLALQLAPALILGVGTFFMPFSPRWLIYKGRDDEALEILSKLRQLDANHELLRLEHLEIKSQVLFEEASSRETFPQYQDGSFKSGFMLGMHSYLSLFTNKSLFRRTSTAALVMFFQQWTGINVSGVAPLFRTSRLRSTSRTTD